MTKHFTAGAIATALTIVITAGCATKGANLANTANTNGNAKVTSVTKERLTVDARYDNAIPAEALTFIEPFKNSVDSLMSPVVGRAARYLPVGRPESPLSNLLADILVWGGRAYNEKPDLAVYNMGGIRAALSEGDITAGDVIDVAPFENKICFLTLTGEALNLLLEQIAMTGGEGVSHGVRITTDGNGRLLSAHLHEQEIDPRAAYRVATLDYLAQGNDHLTAFLQASDINAPTDDDSNVRHIITAYLQQLLADGLSADARTEGRITVVENKQ